MRGRGLRTELVVLIVFAMVPLVAFSLGLMFWGAWLQQRSVEDGLENTTSALSLAVSRELESWKAGLRVIARSAELERGDFAALHARVGPIAAAMGGWIVLFDSEGRQLVNTLVPYGEPLKESASKREVLKVVSTQESTASDLFEGSNAGREIVVVYEPVIVNGTVQYVLGLGMDPQRLSQLLAVQPLPAGRDLHAVEQQVETGGGRIGARAGVERTRRERKPEHEHGCDAMLLLGKATELPFRIRVEIVDEVAASETVETFGKGPDRHVQHRWQWRCSRGDGLPAGSCANTETAKWRPV